MNKEPIKVPQAETVTDFFEKLYSGKQLDPPAVFRGVPLKDRRNLICDCCGDGNDCCGFN